MYVILKLLYAIVCCLLVKKNTTKRIEKSISLNKRYRFQIYLVDSL